MKQYVRCALILVLCFALSLSSVLVGIPAARAAETGIWTPVNTGLTNLNVNCLVIDPVTPSTLYAGTGGKGVFRSTDSGASWTAGVSQQYVNQQYVNCLAINPLIPTTLYAGTLIDGVVRSTDSGATWTAVNTGLTNLNVNCLVIDPIIPSNLYAGTDGSGVFRSTDGGATWTAVNTGLANHQVTALAIDPLTSATLYAGTYSMGVFRSTDGGATWTAVNTGLTNQGISSFAINPATPTTLYSGGGGVCRSTDSGTSWILVNNQYVTALAINPLSSSTLYAGAWGSGVFRSADSGATWTAVSGGLTNLNLRSLAIDPHTPTILYAGTSGEGVFRYVGTSSYALATTVAPSAGGSVVRSPDASSYTPGSVVILTATPAAGYIFAGWSGDLSGTTNPTTITMDTDKTVTATFTSSAMDEVWTYTVAGGNATITRYTGAGGAVDIPATLDTSPAYPVTAIGTGAFYGCTALTSVTIPDSVTSIGDLVFADCTGLTSVTIGSGVTSIGIYAFQDCTALTSVTIPDSVTSIGALVFADCTGLTSVTIGSGVTSIGYSAFEGCTALTSVAIPVSVTSIGNFVFQGCTALTSVTIGSGVTSIGDGAFASCTGLTSVTVPDSVTSIGYAFIGCTGLTSVTIGSGVTSIGDGAFGYCSALTAAYFLGNAPAGSTNVFESPAAGFTVYYVSGTTGWTNPWYGYPTATSVINSYTLTYTPGANGTITGTVSQAVYAGADGTEVTAVPNSGYHFVQWNDGITTAARTDTNVTANISVASTFTIDPPLPAPVPAPPAPVPAPPAPVPAPPAPVPVPVKKQTILILQIGKTMFWDNSIPTKLDSTPVIKNSRTLLPIRAIIEALAGTVGWDAIAHKVTVTLGTKTVVLWIGKSLATVNGVSTPIDATDASVVPEIINSRTMLPLRFVSENLGCTVVWAAATQTITITYTP